MKLAPATILRLVSDAIATPMHGIEQGQQRDGHRHLPEDVGVVERVVERAVADERLADEQHDLRQERERKQDREQRADLGEDVVGSRQAGGRRATAGPVVADRDRRCPAR